MTGSAQGSLHGEESLNSHSPGQRSQGRTCTGQSPGEGKVPSCPQRATAWPAKATVMLVSQAWLYLEVLDLQSGQREFLNSYAVYFYSRPVVYFF